MYEKPEHTMRLAAESEWDALLAEFPDRTVYHTLAWLKALSREHRLRMLLVCVNQGARCVALWPVLELYKGPFRVLGSPLPGWSTAYLGPLFQPGVDPAELVRAMLKFQPLQRWSYFRLRIMDEHRDIDLESLGFTKLAREETYMLDLQPSVETLWNNLKSECRSRIRKAEREGITVRQEIDDGFVDDFWEMSCEVFAKSKLKPPFSLSFLQQAVQTLAQDGRLKVFSAWLEGQRIAALVMPHNEHTMYYWAGGSRLAYRDRPSNNLLHWTALCAARDMGLRWYDFISIVGGPGQFKKTFGPSVHPVATHWEASRHRIIGALKNRYEGYLRSRRALKV